MSGQNGTGEKRRIEGEIREKRQTEREKERGGRGVCTARIRKEHGRFLKSC
jgi:hypothetical protein